MQDKIKVLVVDDSSLVRKIVTDILEKDPMITVVGTANNGKSAIFRNRELDPDVVTMDIEMPILDGLEALKQIIKTHPKPVIMMSVLTQHGAEATFKALDYGAVDFIPKPSSIISLSVDEIGDLLRSKIKSVYRSRIKLPTVPQEGEAGPAVEGCGPPRPSVIPAVAELTKSVSDKIVAIGTSTGGPSALLNVFRRFPKQFPSPVVVVQHMPEGFTKSFSERLDISSNLQVKEAVDGDLALPGCGYIAPGHSHMVIEKKGKDRIIRVYKGEKISGHCPSIDVLFNSVADCCGVNSVGVIMTGMGKDGAEGLLKIRHAGGRTIAQDEESSVVYGMNRVAVDYGAVEKVVPLNSITDSIIEYI